jgi:hypothetical protein
MRQRNRGLCDQGTLEGVHYHAGDTFPLAMASRCPSGKVNRMQSYQKLGAVVGFFSVTCNGFSFSMTRKSPWFVYGAQNRRSDEV